MKPSLVRLTVVSFQFFKTSMKTACIKVLGERVRVIGIVVKGGKRVPLVDRNIKLSSCLGGGAGGRAMFLREEFVCERQFRLQERVISNQKGNRDELDE